MILVGLLYFCREQLSSIRPLSNTAAGVDTNEVVDFLIPYVIQGAAEEFDSRDAQGNQMGAFLEICGFWGDYPASSQALKVKKHSAGAPCTNWVLGYQNRYGTPVNAYSTDIHCSHIPYTRSVDR